MIVYRELKTIEQELGISAKTLYAVSNSVDRHYRTTKVPKSDGTYRELTIPSKVLKNIQKRISDVLLSQMPISPYATAYRPGGSAKLNAMPHVNRSVILKLDIEHFFNSILYSSVKNYAFPEEKYSEPIRVLLTMLCYYRNSLPQGAPTSPAISNIIMLEFDNKVGSWCSQRGINYTRYCDDMTFSGDFDSREVKNFVATELSKYNFFLNERKTVVAHNGQKKQVTGIIVNEKPNISSAYKRKIRQEIYHCKKFGVSDHLKHTKNSTDESTYIEQLLGRVNYVLSVSPDNEFLDYKQWLIKQKAHNR